MNIHKTRALIQGVLILAFVAIAYWASYPIGLGLLVFMGVMKIQESFTDWCPSDMVVKAVGGKKAQAP